MFYAIKCYDSMNMGFHGMYEWYVEWNDNIKDVEDYARNISEHVILSYDETTEALYQNALNIAGIDYDDKLMSKLKSGEIFLADLDEAYCEALDELVEYEIIPLNIECLEDIPEDWGWDEVIEKFRAD